MMTHMVTNLNESGRGSFRAALDACQSDGGGAIEFAPWVAGDIPFCFPITWNGPGTLTLPHGDRWAGNSNRAGVIIVVPLNYVREIPWVGAI